VSGAEPKRRGLGVGRLILLALLLALLIKAFLFQVFFIPSGSMEPTLRPGDRVIVQKIGYRLHDPRRGDVIVFRNPNGNPVDRGVVGGVVHWFATNLGLFGNARSTCGDTNPDEDFVKRIIGLPGDTVQGKSGAVWVNGAKLDEPYLSPSTSTGSFPPVHVPADRLFVMGDNRSDSCDSRFALGLVPIDHVIGPVFVRIWPPDRFGRLP
jgi:signal peptidase I